MGNYITLTELKNTSELIGYSFADWDATKAIAATEAGINELCGRSFTPASGTTTRYYTPTEMGVVLLDDVISVATVATDNDGDGVYEQTWTTSDYLLAPFNAAADGRPYETLAARPYSSLRFTCLPSSVAVTGQFGWPAVPAQVIEATTILATRLLRRAREAPFGVVGLGIDGAAVRISRFDPDVGFLLDPLVKGSGVLAA
jgi:hypothetical protein